jgi:hypothetical protein
MTSEQIEAFLARTGLDAGAVGTAERLLLPEPQVDEARTARTGVRFAAGELDAGLLHVRSDGLGAAGIEARFDEAARTLVLSAPQDLAFGLGDRDVGTRFHVPTDGASAFGLWSAAGPLAIGSIDARAIELRAVHGWPAPPIRDDVNVSVWDRWQATRAAGRIARGVEPDAVEADAIAMRRWPRTITADQRALIERFAIVRARDVESQIARIQDGLGIDLRLDFTWQRICWDRDDVEGVRVLLREAGSGQALAGVLRSVDEAGRAVRFSWPSDVDVHDVRLQQISEADPGAWWGSTRRQVVWL